jgi:hypothetical protein
MTLCVASQRVFIVTVVYFVNRLSPETFGYTFVRCITLHRVRITSSHVSLSKVKGKGKVVPVLFV